MADLKTYLQIGTRTHVGSHRFNREEIIDFASKYDPQPFHLDEQAAANSLFGRLCASGWHTASQWMNANRIYTEKLVAEYNARHGTSVEIGPSPGFNDLKWLKPVYVDDEISFFNCVRSQRESKSRPNWSIQTLDHEAENQHGETVMTFTSSVFIKGLSQLQQA